MSGAGGQARIEALQRQIVVLRAENEQLRKTAEGMRSTTGTVSPGTTRRLTQCQAQAEEHKKAATYYRSQREELRVEVARLNERVAVLEGSVRDGDRREARAKETVAQMEKSLMHLQEGERGATRAIEEVLRLKSVNQSLWAEKYRMTEIIRSLRQSQVDGSQAGPIHTANCDLASVSISTNASVSLSDKYANCETLPPISENKPEGLVDLGATDKCRPTPPKLDGSSETDSAEDDAAVVVML